MKLSSWLFGEGFKNANFVVEESAGPDDVTWGTFADFDDFSVSST